MAIPTARGLQPAEHGPYSQPPTHQELGYETLQLLVPRRGASIGACAAAGPAQRVQHVLHTERAVLILHRER